MAVPVKTTLDWRFCIVAGVVSSTFTTFSPRWTFSEKYANISAIFLKGFQGFFFPIVRLQTIEVKAEPNAPASAATLPPPGAGESEASSSRNFDIVRDVSIVYPSSIIRISCNILLLQ